MQIINTGDRFVNQYLIKTALGTLAVDTGYRGGFENFRKKAAANDFDFTDLRYIFLTHTHDDHVGFVNELLERTNAKLIVHRDAVPRLSTGKNGLVQYTSMQAKTVSFLLNATGTIRHGFDPVTDTDRMLVWNSSSQPLSGFGLRIIPLPGHTADSIGLLTQDGEIFCGDAAMNGFPSKNRISIVMENEKQYAKSWDKILTLGAKTLYPGHGEPFPVEDLAAYREKADQIRLYK